MFLLVYWASHFVCILGVTDEILLNIHQDFHLEGFVSGGYPKLGDIPLLNRKIFKGVRVSIREHPYLASIRRMHAHYSTGTLITKNLIITVAHPLVDVCPSELGVVVGQSYSDRGTLITTVVLVIIHEDFDPYTLASDIALLRLYEDLVFKMAVKPIGLVAPRETLHDKNAFVTGWGRCDRTGKELCLWRSSEYHPDEKMDPMLRSISFKISLQNYYCDGYKNHEVYLKPGMLCVGPAREENPVAPCLAVPGAPLVVKSRLAGMLSWGFGCGYSFDLPLIYTNLQHHHRWLLHNIPKLRKIHGMNITEIFDATRAYVLTQWLYNTRINKPHIKQYYLKELKPLKVDYALATLKGSVYDIRDFINNHMFREEKLTMYKNIKDRESKFQHLPLKHKMDTAPFLSNVTMFSIDDAILFLKDDNNTNENEKNKNITNDFYLANSTTVSDESIITDE